MSNQIFKKEDIAAAFQTIFTEESLLVLSTEKESNPYYVEFALLELESKKIPYSEIVSWVSKVNRFKDVFIYEKITKPLRVRLKEIVLNYEEIVLNTDSNPDNLKTIWNWTAQENFSFDVQSPPLFAIRNIEIDGKNFLLLVYHHLLFDGISVQYALSLLKNETNNIFTDWQPKPASELPKIDFSTNNFRLQNFLPPPPIESSGFEYIDIIIDEKHDYQVLMLKWLQFLKLATSAETITVGEVFSARAEDISAQTAIGYYVQTWPIQIQLLENEDDETQLNKLRQARKNILQFADLPVNKIFPETDFDFCWVVEPELEAEVKVHFRSRPHYVLALVFKKDTLNFTWNLSKVDRSAAIEITKSFKAFLSGNLSQNLPLIDFKVSEKTVLTLWKDSLQESPLKIAVEDHFGNKYSFFELNRAADQLAQSIHIAKSETVGVRMSYSANIIIAFLAIIKKGGIYVPLDPSISESRYQYILKDAKIKLIISDLNENSEIETIHPIQKNSGQILESQDLNCSDDVLYLIYTSGTTGDPKGCAVTHKNLVNLIEGSNLKFDFKTDDKWILAHSYGFDFSTWEIWASLLNGASLYIPDKSSVQDSFKFYNLISEKNITVLNQTPRSFDNLMLVSENEIPLNKLRYLIFGGDKLNIPKIQLWLENYPHLSAVNMYGITETTVHVTFHEVVFDNQSNIGQALPGYSLHCSNSKKNKVPDGFIGELTVGGNGVCSGYYGKASLTKEKFDFSNEISYYFSGDLGWFAKGNFYYLGRNDRQVKIRGYRIELGEIETLIEKQLKEGKIRVLYIDNQYLVSFYTGSDHAFNREQFKSILPDYAIPSFFIKIDSIPLNENGKTDEKKLILHFRSTLKSNSEGQNDNNDIFQKVLKQILGQNLDMNRSFVQNGGDSINAIRIISLLKKEGYQLAVSRLFEQAPLSGLNPEKMNNVREDLDSYHNFYKSYQENYFKTTGKNVGAVYPLSDAQNGILFDVLANGDKTTYVEQLTYRLKGSYNYDQISDLYSKIWEQMPALHLQLEKHNENYIWIKNTVSPIILQNDFTDQTDAELAWNAYLKFDFEQGFELSGPLIRLTIIRIKLDEIRLVWTHHHLLMDGWSLGTIVKIFANALQSKDVIIQNKESYFKFLIDSERFRSENRKLLSYWQEKLNAAEFDVLIPFSADNTTATIQTETNLKIQFNHFDKLQNLGLTTGSFFLAAWITFLSRSFNKRDITLGVVQSMRKAELSEAIGMLIKTVPFRYQIKEEWDTIEKTALEISELLRRDSEKLDAPVHELSIGKYLSHLFVFENYPMDHAALSSTKLEIGTYKEQTAADWTTIVYPENDGFSLRILTKTNRYHSDYVKSVLKGFEKWIANLFEYTPIKDIKLVKPFESTYYGANQPSYTEKRNSVLSILAGPSSKPLILSENRIYSYENIWNEAELWALELEKRALKKGQAVGIEVRQTKNFCVALLAVWMAGGLTCSVDFRYPEKRKNFIYQNAGCKLLFFEAESDDDSVSLIDTNVSETVYHAEDGAFILHTSGSTGLPKGVIQTHLCLINLILWNKTQFGLNDKDRLLQLSSFGFDASYHEVLLAMSMGASLVEIPLEQRLDIQFIRLAIQKFSVSLAWIPARMLNSILDVDANYFDSCTSIKNIVTTGEALTIGEGLRNYVIKNKISLLNFYGPTETHVVTAVAVNADNISPLPNIGYLLDNCSIRFCDESGEEVLIGLPGEIWVSGPHLAVGYLNDEVQTNEKFVWVDDIRWYKTGDWGRSNSNGTFEFLGRKDDQLKIRGFRVETIEVERILLQIPEIQQLCILVEKKQEVRLHAFYSGEKKEDQDIRDKCRELMPDYMIPYAFYFLDKIPLNENGKADRNNLKQYLSEHQTENKADIPDNSTAKHCWKVLLGHEKFSYHSSFYSVGGNSILYMKMQAWLEKNENISCSVRELIKANSPAALDKLIEEKRCKNLEYFDFPQQFPLNNFQKAILWSELGNNYTESPYILSFSIKLKKFYTDEDFNAALEKLFEKFPYLLYTIDYKQDTGEAFWVDSGKKTTDIANSFDAKSFIADKLQIRIEKHEDIFRISWHHILLDGIGIQSLMNALIKILKNSYTKNWINYSSLLNPILPVLKLNIRNSSEKCLSDEYLFNNQDFEFLKSYCKANDFSVFQLLLALLHLQIKQKEETENTVIAFADARFASGLPGMFTYLNNSAIDWISIRNLRELLTAVEYSLENSEPVNTPIDWVVNFMDEDMPMDLIHSYHSSYPAMSKYLYEYQWIARNGSFSSTLLYEKGNSTATTLHRQLRETIFFLSNRKIDQIKLKELFVPETNDNLPKLDDFDF